VRFANPNNINHLVSLRLKGREMETIHTIETPDLTAKLNKTEIDILHFIESWLPTFSYWDVREFGWKLRMEADDVTAAVDMLILHGLLDVQTDSDDVGRIVSVPAPAATWMRENSETIYNIKQMIDTDLFTSDEIAES
tara:strand:- start:2714 stop:3127 length:414 start_codon:yes stop_codon:yes gene_type:complete